MTEKGKTIKEFIKKIKGRKAIGIAFIVIGVLVILSVIIVPIINQKRNQQAVESIKANKDQTTTATPSAISEQITPDAVEATPDAAQPPTDAQEDEAARRASLMQIKNCIGIVTIDKINVELAVVEGTDDESLKSAVGHLSESAAIGQKGNCVISAHHGGFYGEFFQNLEQLEVGDIVEMTDINGNSYLYSVYDSKVVSRSDWSVIENLAEESTLTLITCVDRTQEERIVVSAIRFEP